MTDYKRDSILLKLCKVCYFIEGFVGFAETNIGYKCVEKSLTMWANTQGILTIFSAMGASSHTTKPTFISRKDAI